MDGLYAGNAGAFSGEAMDGRNAGMPEMQEHFPARPWMACMPEMQEHYRLGPWMAGMPLHAPANCRIAQKTLS
jgi:hypothetical protein